MQLPRFEPGNAHLARLRDEGRLNDLAEYIDDSRASRHLRRRATSYIATAKPSGGRARWGESTDPWMIPILTPLLEGDGDPERALEPLRSTAVATRSRRHREKLDAAVVDLERRAGLLPTA